MDHEDRARSLRVAVVALSSVVVLAGAACSKQAAPDRGSLPRPSGVAGDGSSTSPAADPSTGDPGTGGGSNGSPSGSNGSSGSNDSGGQFSTEDLKTYGYAFDDEATLAIDLDQVAASSEKLYAGALAKNVSAAEADASTLLSEAKRTEGDAGSATDRMQPRKPSDPDLQKIRTDALSAFGLTEQYAQTAVDLADAALSLNLQELASVAQQAASLAGTGAELTTSYTDLTNELAAWASANPAAAAKALAQYGT
ncbi:MAG TPA: hypothetical protein VEN82_02685 [Actinomycetota bacterium]|nr:hypothetical protein [Actinomycetota bacterium]